MKKILAPGVEYGEEADLRAEVLRIGGDDAQGIRRRSEQNSVHQFLVLIGDGGQLFGHGEHHMEVLSIEDLRPPVVQPSRTGQRLAFRQCRFRQELYEMRWQPQWSHCSTWPPSAAVRQSSIAVMTRRWTVDSEASCF